MSDDGFEAGSFYGRYYDALPHSKAYSQFCRLLYGADFGQHGFADMVQVQALLDAVQLCPGEMALDLGCGDGRMAEYVADSTGAHMTGLDYAPAAIEHAKERTQAKRDRMSFVVGQIDAIERLFAPASFDVIISVDTLYFTELTDAVRQMKTLLRPGGRMGILYSHGADPWHPAETFPKDTLPAEACPLAAALRMNGLRYAWWDFTEADYAHAQRKRAIIEGLRSSYETEEDRFLCECRLGEAAGVMAAHEGGAHARYLFCAYQ